MKHKKEPVLFSWSGGKDSAMALARILDTPGYEVISLLTTVTEEYDRVSMHGFRRSLLEEQAASLGLPLDIITIPILCTNEIYDKKMAATMDRWKNNNIRKVVFGDIHLADIRAYREEKLASAGMTALFPLWGMDTGDLATGFIRDGFRGIVTCVDTEQLPGEFSGRNIDEEFFRDLPPTVDPCGENGEFHSFVFDGPIFRNPVAFSKGERVLRDNRFFFCDLSTAKYSS